MRMSSLALVASMLLASLVAPAPARASCPGVLQSLDAWYDLADAVFVGRAIEVKDVPVKPPSSALADKTNVEYTARFRVDERFKGNLGDEVTVLAEDTWHRCVVEFEVGERYVVFAYRRGADRGTGEDTRGASDAALRTDHSSPTALTSVRPDAVTYARRRVATRHKPSIVGTVYDRTPASIAELKGRANIGWYGATTRGGVTVVLTGGAGRFTAVTDANGTYYFDDVPEGVYSIRPELSDRERVIAQYDMAPFGLFEFLTPFRIEIKGGGTAARYFTVSSAASVSGRLVSASGDPLGQSYLYLTFASELDAPDPDSLDRWLRVDVDEQGRFRAEVVPPGEYVLAVNPDRVDAFDQKGPRFYYPGVAAPAGAARIRVSDAPIDLGDVMAPPMADFRKIDVAVVDRDGRAKGRSYIVCVPVDPAGEPQHFITDEGGRTSVYLRAGVRFRVKLNVSRPPAGATAEVVANASQRTVTLVDDDPPEGDESQ